MRLHVITGLLSSIDWRCRVAAWLTRLGLQVRLYRTVVEGTPIQGWRTHTPGCTRMDITV